MGVACAHSQLAGFGHSRRRMNAADVKIKGVAAHSHMIGTWVKRLASGPTCSLPISCGSLGWRRLSAEWVDWTSRLTTCIDAY